MTYEQAIYNISIYLQSGREPPGWKSALKLAVEVLAEKSLREKATKNARRTEVS